MFLVNMLLQDAVPLASFAAKIKSNLQSFFSKEITASTYLLTLASTKVLKMFNEMFFNSFSLNVMVMKGTK